MKFAFLACLLMLNEMLYGQTSNLSIFKTDTVIKHILIKKLEYYSHYSYPDKYTVLTGYKDSEGDNFNYTKKEQHIVAKNVLLEAIMTARNPYYSLRLDNNLSEIKLNLLNYSKDTIHIPYWRVYKNCIPDTVQNDFAYWKYQNGEIVKNNRTALIKRKQWKYLTQSDFYKKTISITIDDKPFIIELEEGYDNPFIGTHMHGYRTKRDQKIGESFDNAIPYNKNQKYVRFSGEQITKERFLIGELQLDSLKSHSVQLYPSRNKLKWLLKVLETSYDRKYKFAPRTILYTLDDDSAYYKKDTIEFFSSLNCLEQVVGIHCNEVNWHFRKHHLFTIGGYMCKSNVSWLEIFSRIPRFLGVSYFPKYRLTTISNKTYLRIKRYNKPDELYLFWQTSALKCANVNKTEYRFVFIRSKT